MPKNQLIPNLFRSEYSKIIAVLCKTFGLSNIQLAEDITSETFLKASETWGLKGVPDNPTAWLYLVAKNLARDHFKREKIFLQKITPKLQAEYRDSDELNIDLSPPNIQDSQLQMLFVSCDPVLSKKAQITFALRVLCGFGIKEIANALLSNVSTINKRLLRTKNRFRGNNISLQFPPQKDLIARLENVLAILYLLFNEGYYSASSEKTIQKELCIEAMRLLFMLLEYGPTNLPQSNALMALFCFHSSRFDARIDKKGALILYENQDRSKWDDALIKKGEHYITQAHTEKISKYHLEALIAYWHTRINCEDNEKWQNILQLYNQLIQIEYSPVTALNRTYALSRAYGKEVALKEALKIKLEGNHLYHSLLADLYQGINRKKQLEQLHLALKAVDTQNDRKIILQKIKSL